MTYYAIVLVLFSLNLGYFVETPSSYQPVFVLPLGTERWSEAVMHGGAINHNRTLCLYSLPRG